MAKLSLQHIYKIYDNGTKAVNDFNLEISDDEFVVFVGPSGCGKSTTLRMIAGLEDITAGDFYIDGQLANQLEPKDRDMAMVFQNYALYPHMTVYENMAFGLKIRHVPKAEIDQRVNEAAKVLNIADQLTKKPKAMSGGQRQRVALGRAIVRKPKVFLLDEPLSNLDAKLRSSMRSEIIRLHNVLQTTFIYVTHDQVEAMTMGSKIVVMKDGVIQQVDTPMNLYDYPSNVFVAGFIGTPQMNFLDGKLSLKGENICLTIGDEVLETPMDTFAKLDLLNAYLQKEVKIGIRPEHLFISKDDKNTIKGTISIVEALGNETNIIVDTKGNHRIVLKVLRDDSLQVGDEINIGFNFEKVHLFDKEKENTLLNRIPSQMTYKGKIDKGVLSVAGIKIKLSPSLKDKVEGQKDVYVVIPSHAIIEGKDYSLPITNKDNINKKWLNTLGEKDNSIFLLTDEYQYGDKYEFSIMQEELTILANDFSTLVEPIEKDNTVDGKLIPNKRPIYYYKGTMLSENDKKRIIDEELAKGNKEPKIKQKKYRLFNYQIFNQEITPEDESVIKIYSLLGKKFDLHDIKFIISANDVTISEEPSNISATIKEVFDYGINKYYLVESQGQTLIVKDCQNYKTVGEQVNLVLKNDHIGVYDVNFGVKLL